MQLSSVLQSVKKYTIIFAFTINISVSTVHFGRSFHSTSTSGLKFRQILEANGTVFSKISKKEDNLAKYTQIFENFFRKFSFYSTLLPEFLELSAEWFALRTLDSFPWNFWKLFREISVHLPLFPNFRKFRVE